MIVGVHPLAGFDKMLHYTVPPGMEPLVVVGSLVRMPILRAMRLGVVGVLEPPKDFPVEKLKPIVQVLYPFPALPPTSSLWRGGWRDTTRLAWIK